MSNPLFQPFRALGYITDSVPFAVQRRGKETWVTVSVGKSWQIYNCAKLTLVLVGPQVRSCCDAPLFDSLGPPIPMLAAVPVALSMRNRTAWDRITQHSEVQATADLRAACFHAFQASAALEKLRVLVKCNISRQYCTR